MNTNKFYRVGDNHYSFNIDYNGTENIDFLINSKLNDKTKNCYNLIQSISNHLLNKKESITKNDNIYFKYHNRLYELKPSTNYLWSFLSFFSSFIKNSTPVNRKSYQLSEMGYLQTWLTNPKDIVELDSSDQTSSQLPSSKQMALSLDFSSALASDVFTDPYTQLSTLAFQNYEPFYEAHDTKEKAISHYVLVETDAHELKLTNKDKLSKEFNHGPTVQHYYQFLINYYGKAKIAYIETCYGIDFQKMIEKNEPLTPEIVYRLNIGVGNLESQDLQVLYEKLHALQTILKYSTEDHQQSLDSFLRKYQETLGLSLFEIKGLYRELNRQASHPTVADLNQWLQPWNFSLPMEEQEPAQIRRLVELLSVTDEERERQYTGRKIYYPIQSGYTTAGVTIFKPWIDQQELLQIFSNLKAHDWNNYYEKLCHVVCKKHLVRQHPTDHYRVGALIPAPRLPNQPLEWYKVTSFINNGRGIASYTLEPISHRSSLPAIKLYRSTSSDPYAMDGEASVKNDINPLNPPGYEGHHLSEDYESSFFQERTIPVWVAYQHQADLQIQQLMTHSKKVDPSTLQAVYENLSKATQELKSLQTQQNIPLALPALISHYDAEFLDLLKQASHTPGISLANLHQWVKTISKWSYESPNGSEDYFNKEKEAAETILEMIHQLPSSEKATFISQLLEKRILHTTSKGKKEEGIASQPPREDGSEYNHLPLFTQLKATESQLKELMDASSMNTALVLDLLQAWNSKLLNHAKSLKEDVDSKQTQGVVFTGHSLGGACAQQGLVQFMVHQNRVPLPGHHASLYAFDEPAIRHEDNEAFKDFGNRHAALLEAQESRFKITRRQEEGDFFVTGGNMHLGATFSREEEERVARWMDFDACVQSAVSLPMDVMVAHSPTAHGTQFETGKRQALWVAQTIEEYLRTNKVSPAEAEELRKRQREAYGDYKRTWYTSTIQGTFDIGPKSEQWKDVKNIWNISFTDPEHGENLRLKAGLILRTEASLFNWLKVFKNPAEKDSSLHGEWWRYRDPQGVFAVDEKGLMPKTKSLIT